MKLTFESKDEKIVPVCDYDKIENVQKCTVTSGDEGTFMTITVKVENAEV